MRAITLFGDTIGFGKDGKGAILHEARSQALGALGNDSGILVGTKLALTEDFRMLKAELSAVVTNLTTAEGAGLVLYLVDGDLTLAEAEAQIEANGPLSRHDRVGTEIAERFVKKTACVGQHGAGADDAVFRDMHTNAPIVVVKPRWTFGETTSWNWMVHNTGTLLTTGATVIIKNQCYGVWIE